MKTEEDWSKDSPEDKRRKRLFPSLFLSTGRLLVSLFLLPLLSPESGHPSGIFSFTLLPRRLLQAFVCICSFFVCFCCLSLVVSSCHQENSVVHLVLRLRGGREEEEEGREKTERNITHQRQIEGKASTSAAVQVLG